MCRTCAGVAVAYNKKRGVFNSVLALPESSVPFAVRSSVHDRLPEARSRAFTR